MSKKTILIIISVIVTIGIILGVFYYFNNKNKKVNVGTVDTQYQDFNPFGTNNQTGNTITPNTEIQQNIKQTTKFYRITDFAIAGATFFQDKKVPIPTTTTTPETKIVTTKIDPKTKKPIITKPEIIFDLVPSLRFVEKMNGHIYNMDIKTKTTREISSSTIPAIYEVFFNKEATAVIYRYISSDNKTINSFLATMNSLKGEFLPTDILNVTTSPDKSKFFYLVKNNGGVLGIIKTFGKTDKSQVFTSPFTEWIPQWVNDSKIFLTTKASYYVDGNSFILDTKTGVLNKVLGGIKGLTTLSNNDGTKVLYGASLKEGPRLNIFNIKEHSTISIDTYGLPEKCVWSKNNINIYCAIPNAIQSAQHPDIWYQGLVSFNDRFIKIDATNGGISDIINSEDITAVDATNLFLSDNEEQLFFTNKKDSTLWGLNLY